MSRKGADSRDYIIPFGIFREADVPCDFTLPPGMPGEFVGIFLPQDRAARALRRFPPCAVVLAGAAIWIVTRHSTDYTVVPLASLEALECGRMLLLGWIGLQWNGGSQTLRYNRRTAPTVEEFLQRLKASWFKGMLGAPGEDARTFGIEPNLKFRNAASDELIPDEAPLLQFFQPPVCRMERHFGFRREIRKPGDFLILSNRRLLWITDRHRSVQDQYGSVARSAAVPALQRVRSNYVDGGLVIEIGLRSGALWSVPVAGKREDEAKAFTDMAGRAVDAKTCSAGMGRV